MDPIFEALPVGDLLFNFGVVIWLSGVAAGFAARARRFADRRLELERWSRGALFGSLPLLLLGSLLRLEP